MIEGEHRQDGKNNEHKASRHTTGDGAVLVHEERARKDEEGYGGKNRTGAKEQRKRMANHARHDCRGWCNQRDEHGNGNNGQDHAEDVVLRGRETLRGLVGGTAARCLACAGTPRL